MKQDLPTNTNTTAKIVTQKTRAMNTLAQLRAAIQSDRATKQARKQSDPDYNCILEVFHSKCVMCGDEGAVTLHEIEPKGRGRLLAMRPENRIPVCHKCHTLIHYRPKRYPAKIQRKFRERMLHLLYGKNYRQIFRKIFERNDSSGQEV